MNIPSYCSSILLFTNQKMVQHEKTTFSLNTLVTCDNTKTTLMVRIYIFKPQQITSF